MRLGIDRGYFYCLFDLFLIFILLAILPLVSACGVNENQNNTLTAEDNLTKPMTTPSLPTPGPFEIFITENGFIPEIINIETGTELTWINKDSSWRAVGEAIPTGESAFEQPYGLSGKLLPGATYSQTFDLKGTWEYWCPKTYQTGIVVIE